MTSSWRGYLALERAQVGDAQLRDGDACDAPRELHGNRRALTLDVGGHEIERAIRRDRPAKASATGMPNQPGRRVSERIVGREVVMAEEIGQRAVLLVAPRFRDDVHKSAVCSPRLRTEPAGADLEFLDGLEREREVLRLERSEELAEEIVRKVGAVDVQRQVVAGLTGDAERAAGSGNRPRGRRQQREVPIVAAVDR